MSNSAIGQKVLFYSFTQIRKMYLSNKSSTFTSGHSFFGGGGRVANALHPMYLCH